MKRILDFYNGKKVLVTGHTGFKGSWMCKVLEMANAVVLGYSLDPPTTPNLYDLIVNKNKIEAVKGDIRNYEDLYEAFKRFQPEIVIHMAAQPIVRESYKNPVYTYETNVMGTVNLLECIRKTESVKSVINVTTDKVYLNKEWEWGYRENEELNGFDPYSNSKSCSELITSSYKLSFFINRDISISTCRAGNVIGGGDFAVDRIIPDCVRAVMKNKKIEVRNPFSTRPYQHVLEPVVAYLLIAMLQYEDYTIAGSFNIGPNDSDCLTTGSIVDLFCNEWNIATGDKCTWIDKSDEGPHEANYLRLDCSKIKKTIGWTPKWNIYDTMQKIVEWSQTYISGGNISDITEKQINEYFGGEQ